MFLPMIIIYLSWVRFTASIQVGFSLRFGTSICTLGFTLISALAGGNCRATCSLTLGDRSQGLDQELPSAPCKPYWYMRTVAVWSVYSSMLIIYCCMLVRMVFQTIDHIFFGLGIWPSNLPFEFWRHNPPEPWSGSPAQRPANLKFGIAVSQNLHSAILLAASEFSCLGWQFSCQWSLFI